MRWRTSSGIGASARGPLPPISSWTSERRRAPSFIARAARAASSSLNTSTSLGGPCSRAALEPAPSRRSLLPRALSSLSTTIPMACTVRSSPVSIMSHTARSSLACVLRPAWTRASPDFMGPRFERRDRVGSSGWHRRGPVPERRGRLTPRTPGSRSSRRAGTRLRMERAPRDRARTVSTAPGHRLGRVCRTRRPHWRALRKIAKDPRQQPNSALDLQFLRPLQGLLVAACFRRKAPLVLVM